MPAEQYAVSYFDVTEYRVEAGSTNDFRLIPRPLSALAVILEGEGRFTSGSSRFDVTPGDCVFTPAQCTYFAEWSKTKQTRFLSCHFALSPQAFEGRQFSVEKLRDVSGFREQMELLYRCQHEEPPFSALVLFYGLLDKVYSQLTASPRPTYSSRVQTALDYLNRPDNDRISVEELASLCALSPSHFYACFRQETGCTPNEYRARHIISYAQQLLVMHPDWSIEMISQAAGFASAPSFRRLFKALTGITPLKYRQATLL